MAEPAGFVAWSGVVSRGAIVVTHDPIAAVEGVSPWAYRVVSDPGASVLPAGRFIMVE